MSPEARAHAVEHDDATRRRLVDASLAFAMELEEAARNGEAGADTLDRPTALAELARISGLRSDLLRDARRAIDGQGRPVAAALLAIASVWVVFADD